MDDPNAANRTGNRPEHKQGVLLTAVDLGSNSFYLIQGRVSGDHLTVTRRLRESVRLVAGVNEAGKLDPQLHAQALDCLERFGEITRGLPAHAVRIVATSAVRRLARPRDFLQPAAAALGQPIVLVDGHEEGQLIWLGAMGSLPCTDEYRLIVDVGGGSTECIIGQGRQALRIASIDIGCIVACTQFFADGVVTAARWQQAQEYLRAQLEPHRDALTSIGWQQVWGTSGSARAIAAIVQALGTTREGISASAIADLRQRLVRAGRVEQLHLPELNTRGSQVIAGTVAVLEALFATLDIKHMTLCDSAMREGIIRQLAMEGTPDAADE